MKVIRFKNLSFEPASHEDRENPGVLKKILVFKTDLTARLLQMINWAKLPAGKSFPEWQKLPLIVKRQDYTEEMPLLFP